MVDGPAGTSVGNKINTKWPVAVKVVVRPSGVVTIFHTAPLAGPVSEAPVSAFVKVTGPARPVISWTSLPSASVNS